MAFTLLPPDKNQYITTHMRPFGSSKYHRGYNIMPIFVNYDDAIDFKVKYLEGEEFKDFRVYEVEVNLTPK